MPEALTDGPQLHSAEEIVQGPDPVLCDVRFFKISAELIEPNDDHPRDCPSADADRISVEDEGTEISVNLGLRTHQDGPSIGVRIEFTASHETWRVSLDVSAEFEAQEPFVASEEARVDFANKIGVMALYPYIREIVGNLTQRTVGTSFLLPTIRPGDVSFSADS